MADSRLGAANYEVSPEHVAVSDRKCLKKNKQKTTGWGHVKGAREPA